MALFALAYALNLVVQQNQAAVGYFNDPRTPDPAKRRTILRQPLM